jgi:hypothetical protein
MVALRRQSTIDGARSHGDEYLAVGTKVTQHMHIFGIAQAAFNKSDVTWTASFDIGQRRTVKFSQFQQVKQAFIDIKKGHVAAKASR